MLFLELKQMDGSDQRITINLDQVMLAVPAQQGKSTVVTMKDAREIMLKIPYADFSASVVQLKEEMKPKEKELVPKIASKEKK